MRRLIEGLSIALVVTALICTFASPTFVQPTQPSQSAAETAHAPESIAPTGAGQEDLGYDPLSVVVQFDAGATADMVNESLAQTAGLTTSVATADDIERGFMGIDLIEGRTVDSAVAELQNLRGIKKSQPNYTYHLLEGNERFASGIISALATEINDTNHTRQWYLDSEHGVDAYDAWDVAKTNGSVTVAVLDSGCNFTHVDLADNFVEAYDATTASKKNSGTGDISNNGHGTHVCGIIAATANNNEGVAGVSYNARFIPIQVFYWTGGAKGSGQMTAGTKDLLMAYDYIKKNAEQHNIRVINLSLGGPSNASIDELFTETIEDAYSSGILTVCAAGNDDAPRPYTIYPGDYLTNGHGLNVISVDKNRTKPDYSNYNKPGQKTKDIAAPGGKDTSGQRIYSTIGTGTNSYGELFGTSMATPVVSGVASLVFAANPELTPGQVIDIIHSTATDLGATGWDETYGYGLVNAYEAVKCAKAELVGTGSLAVGAQASFETSPTASGTWTWSSSDEGVAAVSEGMVTGIAPGQATVTAKRGSFAISKNILVHATAISGSTSIRTGETASLGLSTDITGGTWNWSSSDEDVATVTGAGGSATVAGVSAGNVTITASLATNPETKATFDITVSKPASVEPPAIDEYELGGNSSLLKGGTVTLTPKASGSYTWQSSDSSVATVVNGSVVGVSAGTATITASNSNSRGTKSITVYEVEISGPGSIEAGSTQALSLSANPAGGTWNWSSSDEGVTTVAATAAGATVTGVSAGSATITASLQANPAVAATHDIIVEASDEPDPQPVVPEPQPVDPKPQPVEPVTPATPDVSNLTMTVDGGPFVYTGRMITPAATVQAGGKTLVDGVDYKLSYANATNAGDKAMVIAQGYREYDKLFAVSSYFTIERASQKIAVKTSPATVSARSLKRSNRTVHCVKSVSGRKGLLVYSKKSGSKKLSIDKNTGLITVKKKTKKGTYKIAVTVYAKDSANFTKSNTVTKTLKVKVK